MVKVSIIVPIYNVETYLEECIQSLINQTLIDIELILVDDESPDNCPLICESWQRKDNRIKVIHKKNEGLGYARNTGLEVATGEYIGFVDSDDFVDAKMFEKLYKSAVLYNADIAYCGFSRVLNDGKMIDMKLVNKIETWLDYDVIDGYLCDLLGTKPDEKEDTKFGASVCKGIFKKSIIDENKIRFVSEKKLISEDIIWDIRYLSKTSKIVFLPECYYKYRYNLNSLTTVYKASRFKKNKELYLEMIVMIKTIEKNSKIMERIPRYFLTTTRIAIIQEVLFIKQNGRKVALKNISKIAEDELLIDILQNYPYKQMNLKNRIFFSLLKNNRNLYILILLRFLYRRREN